MSLGLLAAVAGFILAFGAVSGRVQRSVITAPMAFTAFGLLLAGFGAGPALAVEGEPVRLVAELTLVLVLFTDAARIDLAALRREHDLPLRLLAIGLPLSVVAGTLAAWGVLPELPFWSAVVLATVLAPTDAALGQAVVSSPEVPVRMRQTLNVESGLNDGLVLPFLLLAVCLAEAHGAVGGTGWVAFAAKQILLGPAVGALVGFLGGRLVVRGQRSGWMSESFQELSALGLSVLAYAGAELVGGNGFIAAFAAGLTLGNTSRTVCRCLYAFAEAQGQLLTLLTFAIFGAAMLAPRLGGLGLEVWAYALLSLTVVRMLPVALSALGLGLRIESLLFLGWFGPRGVASILYGLLILDARALPGRDLIFDVTVATVAVSTLLHGVSAWPATRWYDRRAGEMAEARDPEMKSVSEMPVRVRMQA